MVSRQDKIRTKLANKIFGSDIGKSVTLKSQTTNVYNSRGEIEDVTETESTITIVPYDIVVSDRSLEPFGELQPGEMMFAVPYTVTINIRDKLVIEGDTWVVDQVQPNWLPGNVVTIIKVSKQLA